MLCLQLTGAARTQFKGTFKVPAVLSMDEEEKKEVLKELDGWDGEHESSPAELLTFVFQKKADFEHFNEEMLDNGHLKVFSGVEK